MEIVITGDLPGTDKFSKKSASEDLQEVTDPQTQTGN